MHLIIKSCHAFLGPHDKYNDAWRSVIGGISSDMSAREQKGVILAAMRRARHAFGNPSNQGNRMKIS